MTEPTSASTHNRPEPPSRIEMLELAWGLIANANGGNWDLATPDWREAAIRWRANYHFLLAHLRTTGELVYGQEEE